MEKVYVKTFGCQMNVYDSEKIYAFLQDRYLPAAAEDEADLVILNTCSIREKAEQKVYSLLGRLKPLKEEKPDLLIGVGGCVAQQEGERILARAPMVDIVFGTHNIDQLASILEERITSGRRLCRIDEDADRVPTAGAPRAGSRKGPTALLTIMKGCDNFCAYCVVPLVRGREISRSRDEILEEARYLIAHGAKEITLLGQNVNSYREPSTGGGFIDLLESVDALDGLERLRFVTSHPKDFSEGLVHAMAGLPSVCEHIHLPVQAGSDRILAAMRRCYTSGEYLEKVSMLRSLIPEVEITTDIIVGFPGEERADFDRTLSLVDTVGYQNAFSFRFSARPGTAAADLEDPVPHETKRSWLPELQEVQNRITAGKHSSMVGRTVGVLVEGSGRRSNGMLEGRTRNNFIVHFPGSPSMVGCEVDVRILRSRKIHLEGEVVS
ncbi:MAG: tRNA (N6-isopentenyl adenosine(37)-C2)-methylthiotransferase MiaB [bacterium]|nr:MAG: tRNA (N6-isopentenyl adenosine(37)-C2)-methylthiotransferase MiaB [bacterium]